MKHPLGFVVPDVHPPTAGLEPNLYVFQVLQNRQGIKNRNGQPSLRCRAYMGDMHSVYTFF